MRLLHFAWLFTINETHAYLGPLDDMHTFFQDTKFKEERWIVRVTLMDHYYFLSTQIARGDLYRT